MNNNENTSPVAYIFSVTVLSADSDLVQTVWEIAGRAQQLMAFMTEEVGTYLFLTPAGKKNARELTTQLEAVRSFSKVAVVALSKALKGSELSGVREIFTGVGMDASRVPDDELSLFIHSKLEGQYIYYIDSNHKRNENGLSYMQIKLLKEHPEFSPDWLKEPGVKKEEKQDLDRPFDDIEVREVDVYLTVKRYPPPPPPPIR